jgi:hypothetical protein
MPGHLGWKIFEESRLNFGHDKLYLKVSINPDKPTRLIAFSYLFKIWSSNLLFNAFFFKVTKKCTNFLGRYVGSASHSLFMP